MAEYTPDIRHISGTNNVVADTLSRPNIPPLVNMNRDSLATGSRYRKDISSALHEITYPGIRALRRIISARFVCKKVNSDVKLWCEIVKVVRGVKFKDTSRQISSLSRFLIDGSHTSMSLSNGYSHLFIIIDRSTCWAEPIPLSPASTKDCVEALLHQWISRFGVPASLMSDRGSQFTSAVLGYNTPPLQPTNQSQANERIERYTGK